MIFSKFHGKQRHAAFSAFSSTRARKTPTLYFLFSDIWTDRVRTFFFPQNDVPGARLIKLYSPHRYLPPLAGALDNDNGKNRRIKKSEKKKNEIAVSEKIKGEKLGRPRLVAAR